MHNELAPFVKGNWVLLTISRIYLSVHDTRFQAKPAWTMSRRWWTALVFSGIFSFLSLSDCLLPFKTHIFYLEQCFRIRCNLTQDLNFNVFDLTQQKILKQKKNLLTFEIGNSTYLRVFAFLTLFSNVTMVQRERTENMLLSRKKSKKFNLLLLHPPTIFR